MDYIPYGKQFIDKEDKKSVLNSLSNDLITTGPLVEKFEKELNKYLKCKYSYVCSSGTAAIHLAMLAIGLKKDDVILMPAVNFIASYNLAKIMQLKVFLVDVDEYTGQITPNKIIECIEKNKLIKISVLLTMYMGGFPENVQNLYTLRNKYKFLIIEDACHALGSKYLYKKKVFKIGSCKHADISTFSMHPLKTITSGEGGIITTNNLKIAKNIKLLIKKSIVPILYGVFSPPIHALIALLIAKFFNIQLGDTILLMVLAASASYIAVPAALKFSIPKANPSLYFGISLGITFPINILIGIPFYTWLAKFFVS